jgi:hypothetical protein
MTNIISIILSFFLFTGCQTILRTPAANVSAENVNFKKAIDRFEKAGGTGIWFKASSPFNQDNNMIKYYYQIKTLPKDVDLKSDFFMLRFANSYQLMQHILESGAPVIIGSIDRSVGVAAMTFTKDDPFSAEVIASLKIRQSSIILMQLATYKYEVVHEYMHWLDQQNPNYANSLLGAMNPAFAKNLISREGAGLIYRMISELRGYSVQLQELRKDKKNRLPIVNSEGNNLMGSNIKNIENWYSSEEYDVASRFTQGPYLTDFHNATIELQKSKSKAIYKKMLEDLKNFDFSNDSENVLTLQKLVNGAK